MTGLELRTTLEKSGIRITEAAQIYQVTRVAVHAWIKHDSLIDNRRKSTHARMVQFTKLINKAVSLGYLPVQGAVGKERLPAIRAALKAAWNRKEG